MVLPHHEPEPARPAGLVQIRPAGWCLERLRTVTSGWLSADGGRGSLHPLPVLCVAARDDVVFVVREQVSRTWSLVWTAVTIEVTGTEDDDEPWVVRASGSCERERLPVWAAAAWARAAHPAGGGLDRAPAPPIGLRLRTASVRGYSVLPSR